MYDSVVGFVKSLTMGPCGCYYPNGSFSMSWDPVTGKQKMESDTGPKTQCMRCRARACLEADGIPYDKDDRGFWSMHNMGVRPNVCCANPADLLGGTVTVMSGTFSYTAGALNQM
jgi:hypothetical protein